MNTITITRHKPKIGTIQAEIPVKWVGQGLAVHEDFDVVENGSAFLRTGRPNEWMLTRINIGMPAAFFRGGLEQAIAFAKAWNKVFASFHGYRIPESDRLQFLQALYVEQRVIELKAELAELTRLQKQVQP